MINKCRNLLFFILFIPLVSFNWINSITHYQKPPTISKKIPVIVNVRQDAHSDSTLSKINALLTSKNVKCLKSEEFKTLLDEQTRIRINQIDKNKIHDKDYMTRYINGGPTYLNFINVYTVFSNDSLTGQIRIDSLNYRIIPQPGDMAKKKPVLFEFRISPEKRNDIDGVMRDFVNSIVE